MPAASSRIPDVNGWPEIKGNPLSKVGVFPYLGKTIDPSLDPEKIYMVLRDADELSSPETIQSFRLLPWVDDHPEELLGPRDSARMPPEKKGIEGVIGEDVFFDSKTGMLRGNIKLFSDNLADLIESGKRELSIGYGCRYELSSGIWNGQQYDAIQRDIRGNHLATVSQGRMGPDVAVLDHTFKVTFDAKDIKMADTKEKPDDEKAMNMDEVGSALKQLGKDYASMKGIIDKHFGGDKAKDGDTEADPDPAIAADKAAKDAEEEKMKKEASDKSARDAEEEKKDKEAKDKAACDAAATRKSLDALEAEVKDWKSNTFKRVMGEVKRRDELAGKLSAYVGSFDSAEMTLAETAAYGVEKLGIKCDKGHEVTALDAYFHNRTPPTAEVGFSNDGAAAGSDNVKNIADFFAKAS